MHGRALLDILQGRNYFVITTNVDHRFQINGFSKTRLFYTQGDYGLFQCSVPCHDKTYDNEDIVRQMYERQKDMRAPAELLPVCPRCGSPMTTNLRVDNRFVQDEGWYAARDRYVRFLEQYADSRIVFLELGVGSNTPGVIKYPFWQMTEENPKAVFASINRGEAAAPRSIWDRSILINDDITVALSILRMDLAGT